MTDSESNQADNSEGQPDKRSWFAVRFGSADAWTAGATLFLVFVGIWGVIETKHTLELSERAWISPINGTIIAQPEKAKSVHFVITFSNSGHEPATDLNTQFKATTIDAYDSEFTDMRNIKVPDNLSCENLYPVTKRAVIAPSASFVFTFDTLRTDPALIADEALISGRKFLVINGCMAYRTFEKDHHSSFCYVVEAHEASATNQTLNVVLGAGQPTITIPSVAPATIPGSNKTYVFVPCAGGFESD